MGLLRPDGVPRRYGGVVREGGAAQWAFTDASHAALNDWAKGRLVLCSGCCEAITRALREGA